jgi:hypothetical protein
VFEGVGPEIETFLGPEMGTSVASAIWAQKRYKNNRYINSYNTSFDLCRVLFPPFKGTLVLDGFSAYSLSSWLDRMYLKVFLNLVDH